MKSTAARLVLLGVLLLGPPCSAQEDVGKIVRRFLPPGADLVEFVKANPRTGKIVQRSLAVLSGHIAGPKSRDIVFAYHTNLKEVEGRPLFVALLHKTDSGYVKIFEKTYYNRYLWAQDFSTVGLKLLSVPANQQQLLAVTTAIGASLGATVEVLAWDDVDGLVNTMPGNNSVRHVLFSEDKPVLLVTLSFEKYPREQGVPPPQVYRWDGRRFVKNAR